MNKLWKDNLEEEMNDGPGLDDANGGGGKNVSDEIEDKEQIEGLKDMENEE